MKVLQVVRRIVNDSIIYKVLAILYDGGKAAQEEPRLLGAVENKVCSPNYYL
jgi:hypothetical protein